MACVPDSRPTRGSLLCTAPAHTLTSSNCKPRASNCQLYSTSCQFYILYGCPGTHAHETVQPRKDRLALHGRDVSLATIALVQALAIMQPSCCYTSDMFTIEISCSFKHRFPCVCNDFSKTLSVHLGLFLHSCRQKWPCRSGILLQYVCPGSCAERS